MLIINVDWYPIFINRSNKVLDDSKECLEDVITTDTYINKVDNYHLVIVRDEEVSSP